MSIQIRAMTIDDYHPVLALWRSCEEVGLSEDDSREGIHRYLQRNSGLSFVAVQEGRIVGAVLCGHDGRRGLLHHLAVDPVCRDQGLGRALVECCLAGLAQAGIRKCNLFVFHSNDQGIAFWQRVGWNRRGDLIAFQKAIPKA